jgi:hypothetical protein
MEAPDLKLAQRLRRAVSRTSGPRVSRRSVSSWITSRVGIRWVIMDDPCNASDGQRPLSQSMLVSPISPIPTTHDQVLKSRFRGALLT